MSGMSERNLAGGPRDTSPVAPTGAATNEARRTRHPTPAARHHTTMMTQAARRTATRNPTRPAQPDGRAADATQQATLSELVSPAPTASPGMPAPAGASGDVRIERLILHHLDNRLDTKELVDEVAVLDTRSELFFVSHILAAARRAEWFARFDNPACEIADLCQQLISPPIPPGAHSSADAKPPVSADPADVGANGDASHDVDDATFVAASQALAERLFTQMCKRPQKITPGDFVAIVYTADGRPQRHVALLKLDPDQRLIRTFEHVGGHTRVTITTAGNLLPETVRLQKCALLTTQDGRPELVITLLDNQAGPRSEGVAAFFYRGFLMTTLTPSARRYTRLFVARCDAWLMDNGATLQPGEILRFYRARRAALAGDTVDLATFAADALPTQPQQRDTLLAALIADLFDPVQPPSSPTFPVDRATADPLEQTVTLELDGGATLKVSADQFASFVRIAERRTDENAFRIEIQSLTLREVMK